MLSNTLLQVEKILQKKLNSVASEEILNFLKKYKNGMWIYPSVIKRKFSLSMSEVYEILDLMEKNGILKSYYELRCGECDRSAGTVRLFNELPETFFCEKCEEERLTLYNAILIYKVTENDE